MSNENKEAKYNNRDKKSQYYSLRQRDQEELEAIRDQLVDFCKKHNLPVTFLVQTSNTPERMGVTGFNYSGGDRTADAFYAVSLLVKWLQSSDPDEQEHFRLIEAMISILHRDGEINPLAFMGAMIAAGRTGGPKEDKH